MILLVFPKFFEFYKFFSAFEKFWICDKISQDGLFYKIHVRHSETMKDETKSLCFFCGVVADNDIRFNKIFRPWFLEKRIEHPEKAEVYLVGSCGSASWDDFDRFFQVDVAFKVTD